MKINEKTEIMFKENVHFKYFLLFFYVENIHRGGKMRL